MQSIADTLRADRLAADARRTPAERVALAPALGDTDVETFARAARSF